MLEGRNGRDRKLTDSLIKGLDAQKVQKPFTQDAMSVSGLSLLVLSLLHTSEFLFPQQTAASLLFPVEHSPLANADFFQRGIHNLTLVANNKAHFDISIGNLISLWVLTGAVFGASKLIDIRHKRRMSPGNRN